MRAEAMTTGGQHERERRDALRRSVFLGRAFGTVVAVGEFGLILATSFLVGLLYHLAVYNEHGELEYHLSIGALVGLIFVGVEALNRHYRLDAFLAPPGRLVKPVGTWTVSILYTLAVGFVMKTGGEFSRGNILLLWAFGLVPIVAERMLLARAVARGAKTGRIAGRRILLIGTYEAIDRFARRYQPWNVGFEIVGQVIVRTGTVTDAELDQAVQLGRGLDVDDVFLLMPWSQTGAIERAVDALLALPAAIHLGPEQILDRFDEAHIVKIASMTAMCVVRAPLSPFEIASKRVFDLVVVSAALLVLAPLMMLVALAIRLDSKGPVLFRQQRYGFNQKPFTIFKFRTMVVEEGGSFLQAKRKDPRVTRVGRFLRRWNFDELPQLLNVLRGEMALVGPRPHAVPHNLDFEGRITLYARRHNVKPGITGWAQVNGLRGETDTDDKMRRRVEYDLYYIDNWSLAFDLRILGLTLVSPKAYANAH